MLERLIHEPLAWEIGQPLLTLSSLNKIDLIWFGEFDPLKCIYVNVVFELFGSRRGEFEH